MSLWILIWSSFLLASFWNKTSSLSDVILQMSCTLLLYKTFPDSWFPSHDKLKCHLMVRPSQPSDNRNPVYVLQKWWWGQFKISLLNMWCVCAQVIWGEQKLIICCCKSTCMNQLGNGTWDHVAFMGYSHFHHEHNLSHVVSLIIPRVSFIAWDPYYNNSPTMYNFIKMHSCDIIQLFGLDLYKFNEFYPWPISLLKFLIVPIESHPCNSTHPHDHSHLDGQFDLWT
jgi:hypothetical protein